MQSIAKPHKSAAYESTHLSAKYDFLHPKNPYFQHPIDFFELYKQYHEELSPFFTVKDYAKKKVTFNFKDPNALRALTNVLLRKDFGITLPRTIPEEFLCPPLPNRLNYLCWLDDLTQSTASLTEDITDKFGTSRPLIADIGTGVIGIYALLGAIVFRLRFIASDIDSSSLAFLQEILRHNPHLAESIHPAKLGTHLSQQHFQGFESITFMTPLGHINSVQWNVHVSHETRYRPYLCEVHCRLSILTSGAEAIPSSSSSVSLHSVKTEALKPLIDLRFAVSLSSSFAPSSKASMDIDQVDSHTEEGDEDVHIAVTMILTNSYCAAGLASMLVQRSKDFLEPELERTNRRWRRALQRDVDGGGTTAAGSSANSIEAQTSGP
eukprot:gene9429-6756_t